MTATTATATRVRTEWHTLLLFTAQIADAAKIAVDPATGRLIPLVSEHIAALRRHRLESVLVLLSAGIPAEVIETVTHA